MEVSHRTQRHGPAPYCISLKMEYCHIDDTLSYTIYTRTRLRGLIEDDISRLSR